MDYRNFLSFIAFTLSFIIDGQSPCHGDFKFKAFPSELNVPNGKIELTVSAPATGNYAFHVYQVSGKVKLIQSREVANPESVVFEKLEPAEYLIKIEWGECTQTIGGLERIKITAKAERK